MIHSLRSKTPWRVLVEMEKKHLISADGSHNIQMAVSLAVLLRLMTYMTNRGQINSLSFLSGFAFGKVDENISKSNQDMFFSSDNQWILRYYFTMLPLLNFISTGKPDHKKMNTCTFYDHSNKTKAGIFVKYAQFNKATESYKCWLCNLGYDEHKSLEENMHCLSENSSLETLRILNDIGYSCMRQGEHGDALLYLQMSLDINSNMHRSDDLAAVTHGIIGSTHYRKGELIEALSHHKKTLELNTCGDATYDEGYNNIGMVYWKMGEYDTALSYFKQALDVHKKPHGYTVQPNVAIILNNIGLVYDNMGNYTEALLHHRQCLEMKKKLHGETAHPLIAISLNNIGLVHQQLGDFDNALLYHQQSLSIKERVYGSTPHSDIAISLHGIAHAYGGKGEYDNALLYHQKSLKMFKKVHGDGAHPDTALALSDIGHLYLKKGNHNNNALLYLQQSLEMYRKVPGLAGHQDIASTLSSLSSVYREKKEYDTAQTYVEESLKMLNEIHGSVAHPSTAVALNAMGLLYDDKGNYDLGIKYHKQSLEMKKTVFGNIAHPEISVSLNNIGSGYEGKGDLLNARLYYQQSLQMKRKIYGQTAHPEIALVEQNIMSINFLLLNPDFMNHLLHVTKSLSDTGTTTVDCGKEADPYLPGYFQNIAIVYRRKKAYTNALLYYQQALVMHQKLHGDAANNFITTVLVGIGNVYHAMGIFDVALVYHIQAIHMHESFESINKRDGKDKILKFQYHLKFQKTSDSVK